MEGQVDPASVRALLAEERERALARIAAMRRDWDGIVESSALVAVDDEHDPEGVTVGFERAHLEGLLGGAHSYVAELDRALERLEAGGYGVCLDCGGPIGVERLVARPAATRCIGCAGRKR
jgi:DnaK suppressor protein